MRCPKCDGARGELTVDEAHATYSEAHDDTPSTVARQNVVTSSSNAAKGTTWTQGAVANTDIYAGSDESLSTDGNGTIDNRLDTVKAGKAAGDAVFASTGSGSTAAKASGDTTLPAGGSKVNETGEIAGQTVLFLEESANHAFKAAEDAAKENARSTEVHGIVAGNVEAIARGRSKQPASSEAESFELSSETDGYMLSSTARQTIVVIATSDTNRKTRIFLRETETLHQAPAVEISDEQAHATGQPTSKFNGVLSREGRGGNITTEKVGASSSDDHHARMFDEMRTATAPTRSSTPGSTPRGAISTPRPHTDVCHEAAAVVAGGINGHVVRKKTRQAFEMAEMFGASQDAPAWSPSPIVCEVEPVQQGQAEDAQQGQAEEHGEELGAQESGTGGNASRIVTPRRPETDRDYVNAETPVNAKSSPVATGGHESATRTSSDSAMSFDSPPTQEKLRQGSDWQTHDRQQLDSLSIALPGTQKRRATPEVLREWGYEVFQL